MYLYIYIYIYIYIIYIYIKICINIKSKQRQLRSYFIKTLFEGKNLKNTTFHYLQQLVHCIC